jgi:hypothetical protein
MLFRYSIKQNNLLGKEEIIISFFIKSSKEEKKV